MRGQSIRVPRREGPFNSLTRLFGKCDEGQTLLHLSVLNAPQSSANEVNFLVALGMVGVISFRGLRFPTKISTLVFMLLTGLTKLRSFRSSSSGSVQSRLFTFLVTLTFTCLVNLVALAETTHRTYFKGTDSELDVYMIEGTSPGPTMMVMGGIQGDEPGGYLAADLYADISLKRGNLIVVPRANFVSIVENSRGVQGDMNRKFAGITKAEDRDFAVVNILKELMQKSDVFLNLHDGSGFYAPKWESQERNPLRYGQSIIADTDEFSNHNGKKVKVTAIARRVIERVNPQISNQDHTFKFNNHQTSATESKHKEQRLSATYHALTKVGIPAFGIETSKSIPDYRVRVRYQTMVINAFLEEFGVEMDNPKIFLENPLLKYLIVSVDGKTPIVVHGNDLLKVQPGATIRIVHIEANYSRGLTASVKGLGRSFNDLNEEIQIKENTNILIRKDRFVIGSIPVEIIKEKITATQGIHVDPKVLYFCVKVNDKRFMLEPGEELAVCKGDNVVLLDPKTNLDPLDEKNVRLDLRGFQAEDSPYPREDRGHIVNTGSELLEKYARKRENAAVYPIQAKINNKVFGESYLVVVEPKLEYLLLSDSNGVSFVAYPGDKLELPSSTIIKIMDIRTNSPEAMPLQITMSGKSVEWKQAGDTGIDPSLLDEEDTPLQITRNGMILGAIWLKQGKELRLSDRGSRSLESPYKVRYH